MNRHLPDGTARGADDEIVAITPAGAGWTKAGMTILRLDPGIPRILGTGDSELLVVPLSGGPFHLQIQSDHHLVADYDVQGRPSVFTHVTDVAYAGRDSTLTFTAPDGAVVALPSTRCTQALPPSYLPAHRIPVEIRGAGPSTRQVNNFGMPGGFDGAETLLACEVITPPGNWSSYPPHKHDTTAPCAAANEEIYYYRVAGDDQQTPSPDGFGLHRTYTGPEHDAAGLTPIDDNLVIRDGDIVLIPHGYHGPSVAAPGYPLYFLNVLAGDTRDAAFCDDPAHAWIRTGWDGMPTDPRCPMTSPTGPVTQTDSDA